MSLETRIRSLATTIGLRVKSLETSVAGKANAIHAHGVGDLPIAGSGVSSTTLIPRADDVRLSDARTPTAHSHNDLYFTEAESDARFLLETNNLSDLTNATTARSNLGLGSVTNTSDAAKPVSTAQQTALNGKANTVHTHGSVAEGSLATAYTLTTSSTLVDGLDLSLANNGTSDVWEVAIVADLQCVTASTATAVVDLYIDGSAIAGGRAVIWSPPAAAAGVNFRCTASQRWFVTGLSVGSHTFRAYAYKTSTSGSIRLVNAHTVMQVVRVVGG